MKLHEPDAQTSRSAVYLSDRIKTSGFKEPNPARVRAVPSRAGVDPRPYVINTSYSVTSITRDDAHIIAVPACTPKII